MNRLGMGENILEDIYKVKQFDIQNIEQTINIGNITEKDKFRAAKQILLGLALLYLFTILAYLFRPEGGDKLIDICTSIFPPLATLIIVSYFKDKSQ